MLPDVLIIGAQKAGTTALYDYLTDHDAVAAAREKEVHFFDLAFGHGLDWYRAHFPKQTTLKALSKEHDCRARTCEGSPYYLAHPLVPYRVRGSLPDVKLLVVLRDPVDRALSHHNHQVELGFEQLSFAEAVARESERLDGELQRLRTDPLYESFEHLHHSYLLRGHYADQLATWFALFGRDRFLVIDAGALREQPAETMGQVWDFLDLPPHDQVSYRAVGSRDYDRLDPKTRVELAAHFAESNERLWDLLGERLSWGRQR